MIEGVEGVIGTGIDLVETARIREVVQRWDSRFLSRVFLEREQDYCQGKAFPEQHYAGRFAIKEAVSKGLRTGIGPHFGWLDIEVVRDDSTGAPSVALSGAAADFAAGMGVGRIVISLSHTHAYAVAQAIVLGRVGCDASG